MAALIVTLFLFPSGVAFTRRNILAQLRFRGAWDRGRPARIGAGTAGGTPAVPGGIAAIPLIVFKTRLEFVWQR